MHNKLRGELLKMENKQMQMQFDEFEEIKKKYYQRQFSLEKERENNFSSLSLEEMKSILLHEITEITAADLEIMEEEQVRQFYFNLIHLEDHDEEMSSTEMKLQNVQATKWRSLTCYQNMERHDNKIKLAWDETKLEKRQDKIKAISKCNSPYFEEFLLKLPDSEIQCIYLQHKNYGYSDFGLRKNKCRKGKQAKFVINLRKQKISSKIEVMESNSMPSQIKNGNSRNLSKIVTTIVQEVQSQQTESDDLSHDNPNILKWIKNLQYFAKKLEMIYLAQSDDKNI